jgi:hypothetical protein
MKAIKAGAKLPNYGYFGCSVDVYLFVSQWEFEQKLFKKLKKEKK